MTFTKPSDLLQATNPVGFELGADYDGDGRVTISFSSDLLDHFKVSIQRAVSLIETYTSLRFDFVSADSSSADIIIKQQFGMQMPDGATKFGSGSAPTWAGSFFQQGVVTFNSAFFQSPLWDFEGSALHYGGMHELFHALGADEAAQTGPFDTASLSIMSYFYNNAQVMDAMPAPMTYSSLDILTLQAWFGVNQTFDQLASNYSFSDNYIFRTIYDTGGEDTIDLSLATKTSFIDLRPGYVSQIGGKSAFGVAFSGEVIQAALDHESTNSSTSGLDTKIENAIGTNVDDIIIGNSAVNVISGRGGADSIYGGKGNDTLVGGKGNDILVGNYSGVPDGAIPAAIALEWQLQPTDIDISEVDTADYSSAQLGNAGMTSGINVNMALTTQQVTNDGFGDKDTLVSIEKIIGTDFGDYFNVAGSLKIIDGGDGLDRVSFSSSTAAVQVNLNQEMQQGGYAEGVKLTSIERVDGSVHSDTIRLKDTGSTYAWGNLGHDIIYGGLGTSLVYGSNGNDTYYHRGGKSTFHGENDIDTLDFSLANDGFDINTFTGEARIKGSSTGVVADVIFTNIEKVNGSHNDDSFFFGNGVNNPAVTMNVHGNNGIDTMDFSQNTDAVTLQYWTADTLRTVDGKKTFTSFEKFVGTNKNDSLVLLDGMTEVHGGDGWDTVDVRGVSFGPVTWFKEFNVLDNGGQIVTLNSVESILGPSGKLAIQGLNSYEAWYGTSGNDIINGMGGGDDYYDSAGTDNLVGGNGNDYFRAGLGIDNINGQGGYDTVDFSGASVVTQAMIDRVFNVEKFKLSGGADNVTITIGQDANAVYEIDLGNGTNVLRFNQLGYNAVVVSGGNDNDTVHFGGGGSYHGGGGTNTLVLGDLGNGAYWDMAAQTVSNAGYVVSYSNFQNIQLSRQGISIAGTGGSDSLSGGMNATLNGRGGDDILYANSGSVLIGGAGSDQFIFNQSGFIVSEILDFERGEDKLVLDYAGSYESIEFLEYNGDLLITDNSNFAAILKGAGSSPLSANDVWFI